MHACAARAFDFPLLIAAELLQRGAGTVYGICRGTITQSVTPDDLRGWVYASTSALGLLPALVGTLVGGLLGDRIGISATVVVGALGGVLGFAWLPGSPLRKMRALPDAAE